jgi:hypothetical protein
MRLVSLKRSTAHLLAYCSPGLGVLFDKLQQGIQENQQVLAIARTRADAEDLYGQRLSDITPVTNRIGGGFERDDGASVRKVILKPVLDKPHHTYFEI